MMSSACGSCASASARNAVVGVRSSGLAAVATETRSGRSRSDAFATQRRRGRARLRALVRAEHAVAAAERDDAHAGDRTRPCPRCRRAAAGDRRAPPPSGRASRPFPCSTASTTRSSPTSAPVCACAARAVAPVVPALISTTGLPRARASSSARTNLVPSAMPSR